MRALELANSSEKSTFQYLDNYTYALEHIDSDNEHLTKAQNIAPFRNTVFAINLRVFTHNITPRRKPSSKVKNERNRKFCVQ